MYIARHLRFSTQSFEGRTSALFTSGEALTFSDERRRNTWRPSRLADERRSIIRECTLPPPAEDPKDGSAASACAARTPTCHHLAISCRRVAYASFHYGAYSLAQRVPPVDSLILDGGSTLSRR